MKVLAIRFSAIGDVTMLLPVFQQVLAADPELEIFFVSKPFFEPLFTGVKRLHFIGIELKAYKNISGLVRLAFYLKSRAPVNTFLDLHDSLRTRMVRSLWRLAGARVTVLDKGRTAKALLTRKKNKELIPLMHGVDRYLLVFKKAGLYTGAIRLQGVTVDTGIHNWMASAAGNQAAADRCPEVLKDRLLIGYAPFAGFTLKELPAQRSALLLDSLLENFPGAALILFGGRDKKSELESLRDAGPGSLRQQAVFLASDLAPGFSAELQLIGKLHLMLSMDSGNMHLAAVCGIPVVGLFGTTHPFLGFAPYGQEISGSLGLEGLQCRPCTVYGNGSCYRGDFACMDQLPLQRIVDRVREKLAPPAIS